LNIKDLNIKNGRIFEMKFRKLNGGDAEDLLVLFKQLTKKGGYS